MKTLNDLVLTIQHYLSDYVLIIALLGGGIWFTFKLGFIQVRGFGEGMRRTFGGLFSKKGNADKDGMSSFQALATAIAAQVGTGISPEQLPHLQSVEPERFSGCGSQHSLEWQLSMQKRLWHRNIRRSEQTARSQEDRFTT